MHTKITGKIFNESEVLKESVWFFSFQRFLELTAGFCKTDYSVKVLYVSSPTCSLRAAECKVKRLLGVVHEMV